MKGAALCIILLVFACQPPKETTMSEKSNNLINATSPYLLQHAFNPVQWYPWGEEALKKAKEEDKPIIVSIGYSSCHWCHVMERESFENDSIAEIMNKHFINIKVDREERPDVDQIYMDAVQAMGQSGGWPLNVFLTPDQKPFYGGTYFPPKAWAELLQRVSDVFTNQREEIEKSAQELTHALATSEMIKYELFPQPLNHDNASLDSIYDKLAPRFDRKKGGNDRAPKFPMPGSWAYLLEYASYRGHNESKTQALLTLDEMAKGGIYDQAGGGFARYSVDAAWLVPHFEKMLYDNGQLLSLYAQAYKMTQNPLYKRVVNQTVAWLRREMTDASGGFYAALDADSEGDEGKFYVWTKEAFDAALNYETEMMTDFYNVTEEGNWEEGKNILNLTTTAEQFAKNNNLDQETFNTMLDEANNKLLKARSARVRPGLDDKILAGWNGLMLKGLCDAYDAFGDPQFLELATTNATFLASNMMHEGQLYRSYKEGTASLNAYLEDYVHVTEGFIALYQSTFDEQWLHHAKQLTDYVNTHFYDEDEKFYYFTDDTSEKLISRKKEVFDNVIPSSNSQMAMNLYLLGIILDDTEYRTRAEEMVGSMQKLLTTEPAYTYNWGRLYAMMANSTAEIVIIGDDADSVRASLAQHYLANKVLMGASNSDSSTLPLLKNKSMLRGKTTIYVCYNKTCKLPVTTIEAALEQLQ